MVPCYVLSRIDSYITNTRLPWEDKSVMVPVGALNIWLRDANSDWTCTTSQYYDTSATALAWDEQRQHIFLGVDTGAILVYYLDVNTTLLNNVTEIKGHSARVTSIVYDRANDRIISCGRDKKVVIYSMATNTILSSTRCGDSWLSSMYFDEASQRIFLGSYSNQVLIYDVSPQSDSVKQLASLDGQKGSIRSISYSPSMRYLFTGGFDYSVCMFDIGVPGKESSRSRLVAVMRQGPQSKVKSVAYCTSTRLVLAGYENGMIGVWNSTTAELMFVLDAHKSDVVSLHWMDEYRILISASRDCIVKFWLFPADITKFKDSDASSSSVLKLNEEEIREDLELQQRIAQLNLAKGAQKNYTSPEYVNVTLQASQNGAPASASLSAASSPSTRASSGSISAPPAASAASSAPTPKPASISEVATTKVSKSTFSSSAAPAPASKNRSTNPFDSNDGL